MKHAGVVSSERASNTDSHRIGRLRSSTITFSWVTAASPPHRQAFWLASRPAAYSAPTRSVRTSIWSLRASITTSTGVAPTGVAPPSVGTDLISHLQKTLTPRLVRGFFVPALAEL